jgi:hypothetical protein
MNISTTDAQGLFTKMVMEVYKERSKPTAFLRSFFPNKVSPTLELSIEVQRGKEKVAVDVLRGTEGNRNTFTRSTEKIFIPPYYREWFDATQLQLYDRLYGATEINDAVFAAYINNVVDAQMECQNKIERAYELQCSQVLESGIVTLNNGNNIDFKRKAASLVDPGAGQYWANAVDPFAQLEAGCNFLRQVGKSNASVFNLILGSQAYTDLLKNTEFKNRQNLFSLALDAVAPPQRNAEGASLHGEITCGSYKVRLWTYPQFYDNASGVSTPYVNSKKVVMIPETPTFRLGFAAVPQLITPNNPVPKVGAFVFGEYLDQRGKARIMDVESAGVAIPVAVDTIWTFKAVA